MTILFPVDLIVKPINHDNRHNAGRKSIYLNANRQWVEQDEVAHNCYFIHQLHYSNESRILHVFIWIEGEWIEIGTVFHQRDGWIEFWCEKWKFHRWTQSWPNFMVVILWFDEWNSRQGKKYRLNVGQHYLKNRYIYFRRFTIDGPLSQNNWYVGYPNTDETEK